MGTNNLKYNSLTKQRRGRFFSDDSGDAVVEATILFPVMTMVFASLVLIAVFLPAQAVLQRATQNAATALSTEMSDTWLNYDAQSLSYYWETDRDRLPGIYTGTFDRRNSVVSEKGEQITVNTEKNSISSNAGNLSVICYLNNKFIYKEIIVMATREYPIARDIADLSLIGFPKTLTIRATAVAVVQNGDEFVRNTDIAAGFADFVIKKFKLDDMTRVISDFGGKVKSIFGW